MKGFDDLRNEYGDRYTVNQDDRDKFAGYLTQAVKKMIKADLKLNNGMTAFYAGDDLNETSSPLKRKIKESIKNVEPFKIAEHINFYFHDPTAIQKIFKYEMNIQNVEILSCIGTATTEDKVYDLLTEGDRNDRAISNNSSGSKIILDFKKIQRTLRQRLKSFEINVEGKKDIGLDVDVDELMHGNQVIETRTENGITYNIEKSGDLPEDNESRKQMIDDMIIDLEDKKTSGDIVDYSVNEMQKKTIVKVKFKKLEDYSKVFTVSSLNFDRL